MWLILTESIIESPPETPHVVLRSHFSIKIDGTFPFFWIMKLDDESLTFAKEAVKSILLI